jgi:hypothetical protein
MPPRKRAATKPTAPAEQPKAAGRAHEGRICPDCFPQGWPSITDRVQQPDGEYETTEIPQTTAGCEHGTWKR